MSATKLNEDDKRQVDWATRYILDLMLRFRASYDLTQYLLEKSRVHYREVIADLHANYRIKGTGIKATRANLRSKSQNHADFIRDNQPLAPEQLFEKAEEFPLDAASSSFLFTMIEEYGNFMVQTFNPQYPPFQRTHTAWHHGIHADMDLHRTDVMKKAKDAFTRPFGNQGSSVSPQAVHRLRNIKVLRNAFAHGWGI